MANALPFSDTPLSIRKSFKLNYRKKASNSFFHSSQHAHSTVRRWEQMKRRRMKQFISIFQAIGKIEHITIFKSIDITWIVIYRWVTKKIDGDVMNMGEHTGSQKNCGKVKTCEWEERKFLMKIKLKPLKLITAKQISFFMFSHRYLIHAHVLTRKLSPWKIHFEIYFYFIAHKVRSKLRFTL